MPASIVNLGQSVNTAADFLAYKDPDWVGIHSASPGALSAGPAALTGSQHRITHITLSYSAAPAVSTLTVKDGTTVIWQVEISASAPFYYDFNFESRPLRGTSGAALTVNVGSAGGAVVQTLSVAGFTDKIGTQTSV